MHARVFDAIVWAAFEATAGKVLAGIAVLMALRLLDSLVDKVVSSSGRGGPGPARTGREDGRADRYGNVA